MKRIAIFASGNGSNAENIIRYMLPVADIEVALVLSNKANAKVLERTDNLQVPSHTFNKTTFYQNTHILTTLKNHQIDYIVLAGFMWLVPSYLIDAYPQKILNIHPALLPAYGGKGMYGDRVHQAVKAAKETLTGITIHYVNAAYDEGQIIFQATTTIKPEDTVENIANKVHKLEYAHYPKVIEEVIRKPYNCPNLESQHTS